MTSLVSVEHLENMRCFLCDHFLTVPPILTISRDAQRHKCGRCQHVTTEVGVRNSLFEKLAEVVTYPCTYEHCEEILKWGEVEDHEKGCVHKTLKCPVSWNCDELVSIVDMEKHCRSFHKENVANEEIVCSVQDVIEKSKITVMLLVTNDRSFLVFLVVTHDNIWIKAFSLVPLENFKYEVSICSGSNECCLRFKNPVDVFVENRHCKKCTVNSCDNQLHKKYKKKMDEAVADNGFHKISKAMVEELQMKELKLKITLNE